MAEKEAELRRQGQRETSLQGRLLFATYGVEKGNEVEALTQLIQDEKYSFTQLRISKKFKNKRCQRLSRSISF